ncbi:MAG: hypothetical protein ACE5RN_07860 [Nitrosopumilaceae archaeon]
MSNEIRLLFLFSFMLAFLIPSITFAQSNNNWDEETLIDVSIVGDSVINLDSSNTLLRAYVDITNFDPSDGYYFLRVTQSDSGIIISEENIIIRQKSNGKAGADVAHLITEDELSHTGLLQGNYDLLVFTEKGNAVGNATFSIIKPSIVIPQKVPEQLVYEDISVENDENIISDSKESESELINIKKIPDWVKNIFVLYSYDEISEKELLAALKYLIEENIIEIN